MAFDLGIVVITYNSRHVLPDLLDSLPAALDGLRADVVVVDNDSKDGTAELVASRNDCRLVRSANDGYAAGINRGERELGPVPAVLVLNPDVRLSAGCVARLLDAAANDGVGIVAPRILSDDGTLFFSLRREPTLLRAAGLGFTGRPALAETVDRSDDYERPHRVDWALGAALLVTTACSTAVGPWNESFFLYSEETDFCLRARDRGWATFYEPAAVVTHIGGASGRTPAIHAMQIVNRVRLYAQRHHAPAAWLYFVLAVASEVSWWLRGHEESRFAVRALLRPGSRPAQLRLGRRLLPR